MSSILKALKKLEHEKVVRRPDSFRIDAEILRARPKNTPRRLISSSGASLAAIALILCGSGVTYLFVKRHDVLVAFQPAQPSITEVKEIKAEPPKTVLLPPNADSSLTDRPPYPTPHKKSRRERAESPIAQIRKISTPLQGQLEKDTVLASRTVRPELKPIPQFTTPVTTAAPTLLKVNGIAFQDGGANSVAVVNGIVVSKSTVIEGVRVEEIQKDRVRFSRGAERFDILLDK